MTFTNIDPQDQEIGKFYEVQEIRATDFEAIKLRKGRLERKGLELVRQDYMDVRKF